jgi:ethanolamine ammonia-lyase small subunit
MSSDKNTPSDAWQAWRAATPARIGLGRVGDAVPTAELLRFGWAHAGARDAIHAQPDLDALGDQLQTLGWPTLRVQSRAGDRATYLRRPDLGRLLDEEDARRLPAMPGGCDVCIVVGDGLSALAIERHAVPLLEALKPLLPADWRFAPLALATQARVALADELGERFGARLAVMLIGERPGLSSPDSLGIYLTHSPQRGRTDAQRNCISNVRGEGLAPQAAAARLAWLMREALRRGLTGIELKDESEHATLQNEAQAPTPTIDAEEGDKT